MDYDYNRKAFRSVIKAAGVDPLAGTYCLCVLLELSIKQHLALCSSASNSGHDLPYLLQRVGLRHRTYHAVLNSLQLQLANSLKALSSQGRDGQARFVPSNSYPHIRYLRHASDWGTPSSSDSDIASLKGILQRIISLLGKSLGIAV
jgi:hypothetical protein